MMNPQPATGDEPNGTRPDRGQFALPFALPVWLGTTARRSWSIFRLVVLTIACGVGAALIVAIAVSVIVTALSNGVE
jgi:hypothetical protein